MNAERQYLQDILAMVVEHGTHQQQAFAASTLAASCNLSNERAVLLLGRALDLLENGLASGLEMILTTFALERAREAADWREGWVIGAHFLACLGSHSADRDVALLATTAAMCATDELVSPPAAYVASMTALAMVLQGLDDVSGEELLVVYANNVFPHLTNEDDQIGIARTLVQQVDEHCHPQQPRLATDLAVIDELEVAVAA